MLAIVVAGGAYDPPARLAEWRARAQYVVAADRGAAHAQAMGLALDLAVGDMDSLPPAALASLEAASVPVERHMPGKDQTDTELAVQSALNMGADELVILCALGGRVDHELANVLLLARPGLAGRAVLASGDSETCLIEREHGFAGRTGDMLTLLPLGGAATDIWTEGLQYPLRGDTLPEGVARGVSNVFVVPVVSVRMASGRLLAVHTRPQREPDYGGANPSAVGRTAGGVTCQARW